MGSIFYGFSNGLLKMPITLYHIFPKTTLFHIKFFTTVHIINYHSNVSRARPMIMIQQLHLYALNSSNIQIFYTYCILLNSCNTGTCFYKYFFFSTTVIFPNKDFNVTHCRSVCWSVGRSFHRWPNSETVSRVSILSLYYDIILCFLYKNIKHNIASYNKNIMQEYYIAFEIKIMFFFHYYFTRRNCTVPGSSILCLPPRSKIGRSYFASTIMAPDRPFSYR